MCWLAERLFFFWRTQLYGSSWLAVKNVIHMTIRYHEYFFFYLWGGTFGTAATTGLLYHPRILGDGDCGKIGRMKIGRGNRSTRRKPAPAPLCPPQISHDYTWVWTRAAAVESQRLTAWAMARPIPGVNLHLSCRNTFHIIVKRSIYDTS
jgi:hypothetical protein